MTAGEKQPISFESLLLDNLSFYTTRFYAARSGGELKDIQQHARKMHTAYNLCKKFNIPMIETERSVLKAIPETQREMYLQDILQAKILPPKQYSILAEEFQIKTP